MKDELTLIEQGYLIEALSPRGYSDIRFWIKKDPYSINDYTLNDILASIPLPWYSDDNRYKIFEKLVKCVAAKEAFEKRIETCRRQAFAARKI